MAFALHAPRVNNNDDIVQVIAFRVAPGDLVKKGDVVVDVETDKAIVEVEAECDGYVLKLMCEVDDKVAVGSILLWQGDSADEPVPEAAVVAPAEGGGTARPTAKARALLKELGLDASVVPATGERLSLADVESYMAAHGIRRRDQTPAVTAPVGENLPDVPGELVDLSAEERGMLITVSWHRDHAAATYLEVEYDPKAWEDHAAAYASANKLMLSPLLPLLAYRFVQLVKASPRLNATVVNGKRFQYKPVNLGFTVQAGETLYLTVVRDADSLETAKFIEALGEVQRHAIQRKLSRDETSGATIAFSSMARWNVSRHIPILPPYCSLMIAHAAPKGSGRAVLGASYDHRVLSGFDVARLLMDLAKPPV
ncbi:MAG: 2-oxo acid dehydrogenase subunit E2 [Thiobacillaceae bacterium]|jgi:pyruvate/2-oxoglutarate dehydrogenase complex dihydrolipoamide acyltransferase (E2) component|nr:2-oxo acid dehydrogenase subunit E2 [Thiobacillaceae bacterium]